MINKRLSDILTGNEDNYLMPFYWQHGNHRERIPEQIERIQRSGCRALCVESRPHPDFGKENWWIDMDLILAECKKRDMKVWLLDDKHFPTGYANGLIREKYPHLRKWHLTERHIDVCGPFHQASLMANGGSEEEPLIGVFAYPKSEKGQEMYSSPIDLTDHLCGRYLYWDIPAGAYRIFFLYKTRRGYIGGREDYIDMISPESAAVQIEAVYQPHYDHYKEYFGNTFVGFFSDEPDFGNDYLSPHQHDLGFYEKHIGREGLALPYNEELLSRMTKELGEDALPYLPELWYESEHSPVVRLAYMNAATGLYKECFSDKIGNWCRDHGVEYIGHVIEDMNIHARLGHGSGHYFRALSGQDMSGIDIVLHQVLPGMAHYMNAASVSGGVADGRFYHYTLTKLASSLAAINPRMGGRAMCEVFGAYGWGEGSRLYRWLMDFLLVRGINHFVPHAFSPNYPDGDCPPHFGAEGHDPQFDAFSALMSYTNKAAHLLTSGRHVVDAAILYHAEGEWMNHYPDAMLCQVPGVALYDAHIDYDILPLDALLEKGRVENRKLHIEKQEYRTLVIPYAKNLPEKLRSLIADYQAAGVQVLFADALPAGFTGEAVPVAELPAKIRSTVGSDLTVDGEYPLLRIFHREDNGRHTFMLFNESISQAAETVLHTGISGDFARLMLLEDKAFADHSDKGDIAIHLLPGQSEILVFSDAPDLPAAPVWEEIGEIHPQMEITIAHSEDLEEFVPYLVTDRLHNINGPDALPDFSGKMRYRFALNSDGSPALLDLGDVGQSVRLFVNGSDCGIRLASPYTFDLRGKLNIGDNEIIAEVSNTLVGKVRDYFSSFLTLAPAGILGPIRLFREKV